jgi:hypothetical protein
MERDASKHGHENRAGRIKQNNKREENISIPH